MIRELVIRQIGFSEPAVRYKELAGLSTDTKPVDPIDAVVVTATGSRFLEVDTGDVYAYDEEVATWHKIASGPVADDPVDTTDPENAEESDP